MGRRKLEMKRIEDKSSRLVTFSKRRGGLFNKARQLSALCDADVAVVVFSARGKLYEFCSGSNSVEHIISRYERSCVEAETETTAGVREAMILGLHSQFTRDRTCDELLSTVKRFVEEPNREELSVNELTQLEEEITVALMQIRSKKTQLMMEYTSTLRDKERKLSADNKEIEKEVVSAKQNPTEDDASAVGDDAGGGGLNGLATNQINLPQLSTLPLFT